MGLDTYHKRKEKCLCVDCGKVLPPRWGWVYCIDCRETRKIRYHRKYEESKVIEAVQQRHTKTLDEMAIESKEKHLTYGQLQAAETIERMRGETNAERKN